RMLEVPEHDGETMFADTAAAFDDLPDDVKIRIEELEYKATLRLTPVQQTRPGAFWRTVRPATAQEDPEGGDPKILSDTNDYPSVIHPVVMRHPESGRRCIFLSPT